ncbi:MAG: DUF3524 domain-containing protein [Desulfotalea sp.]
MKKILILEPYYGGSHKQFLLGLQENIEADYTLLSLPARKWKMRMQLSAPWFVEQIKKSEDQNYDVVLCSTFLDVAVFKALVSSLPGWSDKARILTYFHENQFEYPNQLEAPDTRQFATINLMSALASDSIAFNSEYNRTSFLAAIKKVVKIGSDMKMPEIVSELEKKSEVIYPGIDFSSIDNFQKKEEKTEVPTIVWNHRWEHDKNPEEFFKALQIIKKKGVRFKLIVLGQSFRFVPNCFEESKEEFAEEIIHFGYAESYSEYIEFLSRADIVVSTAIHEFYGISVIEAVRAGCRPLLPARLSYPELFEKSYLYKEKQLAKELESLLKQPSIKKVPKEITDKFSWPELAINYKKWLFDC